jgi:signal transduction histidine kinase/CheY-like chemotaxis protein
MKEVLNKRNKLFFSYLKLKSNLIDNKNLTKRIDTLSTIIGQKKIEIDTSVVTTQKRTTTTYLRDTVKEKDERPWISRVFGKKKETPEEETTHIKVQEELSVSIDTLAIAKQNKALEEVEKIVSDLETDQRTQSKRLLNRELELIRANSLFINELLGIFHDVEREELALMRQRNDHASLLMSQSIARISTLLVIFFLGAALLVYLIWIDISNSNYYKEQLEKARDEAEELSKIKQRFLANMSHEIRTPLQSIIGFAEQIRGQRILDRDAAEAIYSSSEHLLHIVNEVLDYSRISSGNFTLAKETFPLMSIIREVESAMRIQADRKQLTFLIDLEQTSNYTLCGDSFRLRQILYNLLGNAVKFTSKGYVKLTVKTVEDRGTVRCFFDIMDTGIGIREEDLKKIFNQFEQANTLIARHYGGTGLGLTIVKSLIEAQHGTLNVTSEPGQGSTFSVVLSYVKAEKQEPAENPVEETIPIHMPASKIIVVDDDPMILRLCGLILTKNAVEHTIFKEAEKLINEKPDPEVSHILMDIRMPHINGVELCHTLRKKYPPQTRFIALTAHVFPQEREALLAEGFDIVLSKPFHEEDLLKILGVTPKPASTPVTPEPITVDLSTLRQMTLGDESLFQSVIHQFIEETRNDIILLDENLKHMESGPIREIIHKLAGRVGQIGVLSLSLRLRTIEENLVEGYPLSDLVENILDVKEDVKNLLKTIRLMAMEQWN